MPVYFLDKDALKSDLEVIRNQSSQKNNEFDRYNFYEGHNSDIIMRYVRKEYESIETINQIESRLLPINMKRKVINKCSAVYDQAPMRIIPNEDEQDAELLGLYEDSFKINRRMRDANRSFSQFKKALVMPYVDDWGVPRLRYLPCHTYHTFSYSEISPQEIGRLYILIEKGLGFDENIYSVWTPSQHLIVNGRGEVLANPRNPDNVNPFGVIPAVYVNDSDLSTEPVQMDDLFKISIAVPIIFSDLSYGIKYMAYSLLWTVGVDEGSIPTGPGAIIHLNSVPADVTPPSINSIKPQVDIDGTIKFLASVIEIMLDTRNIKANGILNALQGSSNIASGISKAIDEADNMEQVVIQQEYFYDAERELWQLVAKRMVPYWRASNMLADKFNMDFSDDFDPIIIFKDPQIVVSEKERIEIAVMRLKSGLSTLRRELAYIYPDMSESDIDKFVMQIREDKRENMISSLIGIEDRMSDDMRESE